MERGYFRWLNLDAPERKPYVLHWRTSAKVIVVVSTLVAAALVTGSARAADPDDPGGPVGAEEKPVAVSDQGGTAGDCDTVIGQNTSAPEDTTVACMEKP